MKNPGKGSVFQRKDGRWVAELIVDHDRVSGAPKRKTAYFASKADALKWLNEKWVEVNRGIYIDPSRQMLCDYLDDWLSKYTASVKEMTLKSYKSICRVHIIPEMGYMKLCDITTDDIQDFVLDLLHGTGESEGSQKPHSPKTVKNVYAVLSEALDRAVKLEYIYRNPAKNVDLPRLKKTEIKALSEDNVRDFLSAIKGSKFENLYAVDLMTGMRMGEILGLTWDCIDVDTMTIWVKQQLNFTRESPDKYVIAPTKTNNIRDIRVGKTVMQYLAKQRMLQIEQQKAAGDLWQDTGFVFTNALGDHVAQTTVFHTFKRIVRSIGIGEARFHDLRHTYATMGFTYGDDPKTVQHNLGHTTLNMTLGVYTHATEDAKSRCADNHERFYENVSKPVPQKRESKQSILDFCV